MEIKITITGIEQFTEAVSLLASAIAYDKGMKLTGQAAEALIKESETNVANSEFSAVKENEGVTEKKENVIEIDSSRKTEITIEDVRSAFMTKNTKTNTAKLKAILTNFGVKKVTDLKEKDFEAVLKALEEI